jgi:hypothetical protein
VSLLFHRRALSKKQAEKCADGNGTLTLSITGGAFQIMGDKSPKANQKQKAQKKAQASSAIQKKQTAAAAKAAPQKK